VQTYIARLRSTLGSPAIETCPPGYLLRLQEEALDAARFRRLVGEARRLSANGETTQAAGVYSEALLLWRGPALADVTFESFARREVDRLDEERVVALMDQLTASCCLATTTNLSLNWRRSSASIHSENGLVRS